MSELTNKIRADFEGVSGNDFPLHIFPQQIQSLVLDLKRYNGFSIEYTSFALISALSTAVGNTYRLNVFGEWQTRTVFYILIVGLPGACKSHPINFAFKPLEDLDMKMLIKYNEEMISYEQSIKANKKNGNSEESMIEPICKRTVHGDTTPEALIKRHDNNQKGVAIKVDEFFGMIKSSDQYNKGQFIESILSIWSGCPMKVDRCSNPAPAIIRNPHINIIGTMQPGLLSDFINESRLNNGFIDRCIFVYPKHQEFDMWHTDKPEDVIGNYQKPSERWARIIQKFIDIDYEPLNKTETILQFNEDARIYLFNWRNEKLNSIPKDTTHSRELGRFQKQADYATRFSLLFQLVRWACGECSKDKIDLISVKSAIHLTEWIEESFLRVQDEMVKNKIQYSDSQTQEMLSLLPDEFKTSIAIEIGDKVMMKERTVNDWLKRQVDQGVLEKQKFGIYKKKVHA